jgi:hypothetical protein
MELTALRIDHRIDSITLKLWIPYVCLILKEDTINMLLGCVFENSKGIRTCYLHEFNCVSRNTSGIPDCGHAERINISGYLARYRVHSDAELVTKIFFVDGKRLCPQKLSHSPNHRSTGVGDKGTAIITSQTYFQTMLTTQLVVSSYPPRKSTHTDAIE